MNLWMSGSEWKLAYPSKAEMWWEQFSNKLFFMALAEIIVYGFSLVNCIFSEHPGKTFCLVKGLAWGGTVIEKGQKRLAKKRLKHMWPYLLEKGNECSLKYFQFRTIFTATCWKWMELLCKPLSLLLLWQQAKCWQEVKLIDM